MKFILRFYRKIIRLLNKVASLTNILISFLSFALTGIWLMIESADLDKISKGLSKPDFRITGYGQHDITVLFRAWGNQGRADYFFLTVVDTFFPFFVAAFCTSFFWSVYWRISYPRIGLLLVIASLIFMITDLCENVFIFLLLMNYPTVDPDFVSFASICTVIKLPTLLSLYVLIPVTGIFYFLVRTKQMLDRLNSPMMPGKY